MRPVVLLILGLALGTCADNAGPPLAESPEGTGPEASLLDRAREIHRRVVTIDTHDDIPFDFATVEVDPGVRGDRQVDLPKMVEGGLDVAFFIAGHNDIADSAAARAQLGDPESEHDGVSSFGEEVIAEMNRLGMMVDVSHISKAAMLDASRLSVAPIIASHSSTRALRDHPRNMDDEQLRALQRTGGVIQTVALDTFVSGRENPPVDVADFVDHIDYAVGLVGIDHVGISSDFDGGGGVEGWNDASETLNVTVELVRRGYTEEEIAKLRGGNLLRVWRQVEAVAEDLRDR